MRELNLDGFSEKVKKLVPAEKRMPLIVALGLAGMLLILLSQLWDDSPPDTGGDIANALEAEAVSEDYVTALEDKLGGMIASVKGVGRARIMVTLENTGEYVYAQEEKRNVDTSIDPGSEGSAPKSSTKENIQQSYILMNGQKEALVKTRLEPKIRGVVIVCEGADDAVVRQSVVNIVTTALNIPTTRVCVEKISP